MCGTHVPKAGARRRREVHDVVRETGKRMQRIGPVEIAPHRLQTQRTQLFDALTLAHERIEHVTGAHERNHTHRDVSAADDQQPSHLSILAYETTFPWNGTHLTHAQRRVF